MNTDCIFCSIVAGTIPSIKVYEDEYTYAFLDIKPINPGHTLVIPKAHYANIFEIPADLMRHYGETVKKVSHAVYEGVHADGLNITMNNGEHAGQIVFHAHIHLMPRFKDDGYPLWKHKRPYHDGEALEVAEKIKKVLE